MFFLHHLDFKATVMDKSVFFYSVKSLSCGRTGFLTNTTGKTQSTVHTFYPKGGIPLKDDHQISMLE